MFTKLTYKNQKYSYTKQKEEKKKKKRRGKGGEEIMEEKTPLSKEKKNHMHIDLTRNMQNIYEEMKNTHKNTKVDLE